MLSRTFHDFDAFADSIHGVESKMMLRNPRQRTWRLSVAELLDIRVQLGQLGSGNIAAGQLGTDACMVYMPLTDACEYSANGIVLEKDTLAILEPGCEFCVSTRAADAEEVTVSTILVEHGEWEFSRFASRYRRLFGELPSETLRTKGQ